MVKQILNKARQSLNGFLSSIAGRMNSKFEKDKTKYNTILAIANILDPRYKVQFVDSVIVSFMI